jgi:putative cell wall-binding protein
LLVQRDSIPPATWSEVRRLGAKRVVICGGLRVVSAAVQSQFAGGGLSVERLAGPNRFETAVVISQRIEQLTGTNTRVYIARGDLFPDALSLAPFAYSQRVPILLTAPKSLTPGTQNRLAAAHYTSAAIAGATMSVSTATERSIQKYVPSVQRWAGANRYDTGVECASHGTLEGPNTWAHVGVAKGTDFPDALCGGTAMGHVGGAVLLTEPNVLPPSTANALAAHAGTVIECDVYGGAASVTPATYEQIRAIFR